MSTPHNDQALGKPLGSKKKRSAVFIVIVASIVVHILAGLGLAAVKIIEVLQPEPEFEAPPVVENKPPPPPPPPPPTNKRAQRSLPRPQPLAARNPQNMSVPAIEINNSDLAIGGGRGFGGGLGSLGGAVADSLRISFFGMESTGGNVVILLDCSWSGAGVFNKTRAELMKTLNMMKSNAMAKLSVIYFGGNTAGYLALRKEGQKQENPLKQDFWYPRGVRPGVWFSANSREADSMIAQLKGVNPNAKTSQVNTAKQLNEKGAFFVLGTQYWGAFNAAFSLDPAPDTIYFMVEPGIAFPNSGTVEKSFAVAKKQGLLKPENTKIYFVVANPKSSVKDKKALYLMVNLMHGGRLSQREIDKLIIYD